MKRTALTLSLILVVGIIVGTAGAAIIADSVGEFSGTLGQNNWHYGYYDGPFTNADFQEMTQFLSDTWWVQEGTYWTSLSSTGGHPNGLSGNQGRLPVLHWAVRRWVSEVTGIITISGTFASIGGGDTTVYIIVDGVQVWSQYIPGAGSDGNYMVNVAVQVGSAVDFAIDPGPNGDDVNDATEFTATMSFEQPPPLPGGRVDSVWLFGPRTSDPCHNFCSGKNPKTGDCICPAELTTLEFPLLINAGDCGFQIGVVGVCIDDGRPVGGAVTGVSPRRVICRNVTTGQRVVIRDRARAWDCEAMGLIVETGNTIQQTVTGTAD